MELPFYEPLHEAVECLLTTYEDKYHKREGPSGNHTANVSIFKKAGNRSSNKTGVYNPVMLHFG